MINFSTKPEYYQGKREQRKKVLKITGIVLAISAIIAGLSFLFLNLFEQKPYCFTAVFCSVIEAVIALFFVTCLFFFLKETILFIKESKKKKALPLSPAEMKAENINSAEEYADWLNEYLAGCFKKKLTSVQLKTLAKSYNVYYHPALDLFDVKENVTYYTEYGQEYSLGKHIKEECYDI